MFAALGTRLTDTIAFRTYLPRRSRSVASTRKRFVKVTPLVTLRTRTIRSPTAWEDDTQPVAAPDFARPLPAADPVDPVDPVDPADPALAEEPAAA